MQSVSIVTKPYLPPNALVRPVKKKKKIKTNKSPLLDRAQFTTNIPIIKYYIRLLLQYSVKKPVGIEIKLIDGISEYLLGYLIIIVALC